MEPRSESNSCGTPCLHTIFSTNSLATVWPCCMIRNCQGLHPLREVVHKEDDILVSTQRDDCNTSLATLWNGFNTGMGCNGGCIACLGPLRDTQFRHHLQTCLTSALIASYPATRTDDVIDHIATFCSDIGAHWSDQHVLLTPNLAATLLVATATHQCNWSAVLIVRVQRTPSITSIFSLSSTIRLAASLDTENTVASHPLWSASHEFHGRLSV